MLLKPSGVHLDLLLLHAPLLLLHLLLALQQLSLDPSNLIRNVLLLRLLQECELLLQRLQRLLLRKPVLLVLRLERVDLLLELPGCLGFGLH